MTRRLTLGFLVMILVAGLCAVSFAPISIAQEPTISLESRHESGASMNLGTITFDGTTYILPTSFAATLGENHQITYNPAPGYSFVRWEIVATGTPASYVGDPNAKATYVHLDSSTTLRAVYTGSGQGVVGGEFVSVNKPAVFAPYLALLGLVAAFTLIAVVFKKKTTG